MRTVATGVGLTILLSLSVITVYAQLNQTQIWTDTENNIKILFTYSPKNPVVDKPTVLHFSVFSGVGKQVSSQNLLTGKYLKNLMATVVIVTNSTGQETSFKFNHVHSSNGTFSVKYLFPDSGFYQIITRINSNNPPSILLASFSVIVTPQTSSVSFIITLLVIISTLVVGITYFIRTKHRHHNKRTEIFILIAAVSSLVSVYFFLSFYVFPHLYITLPKLKPMPEIYDVKLSSQIIGIGQSFYLTLTGVNTGDSADFQTISVGFPNLTTTYDFVKIIHSDFNQKLILIKKDEMVGSSYQGTGNLISAKYPSIEAFSRPWHSQVTHHIEFEITPMSIGRFVILLKSVAFPHLNQFAHYPLNGLKDYQNEFVKAYSIQVVKDR
ncbi:MAG TPA: hypothetical protein VEH06_17410 [Candidatus Bathyarchaeia archaeon]|nr:hypothetical protein [Candidatus Bathyarchaeia archaeon]